jgi:hypothetical protein
VFSLQAHEWGGDQSPETTTSMAAISQFDEGVKLPMNWRNLRQSNRESTLNTRRCACAVLA